MNDCLWQCNGTCPGYPCECDNYISINAEDERVKEYQNKIDIVCEEVRKEFVKKYWIEV